MRVRRLMGDRNLRVLFVGQLLNMFGNTAMVLVLGIWVKELTGSSGEAGLIFLLLALPTLVSPFTGLLVDRVPRRIMLLVNDLCSAVLMASLVFVHDRHQLWLIYLVTLGYGFSSQIYRAARGGLLHSMVSAELLGDVNALFSTLNQALRIVGPLVGASLYLLVGGGVVALLDSATYVISGISYIILGRVRDLVRDGEQPGQLVAELVAGIRHVLTTTVLRQMVTASAIAFAGAGMIDVAIFALVDNGMHRPAPFLGVLGAVQGSGAVLGALVAAPLLRRHGEFATASAGFLLNGVGLAAAASATLPAVVAGEFLIGIGLPMVLVAELTLVQRRTDQKLQGRAISASDGIIDIPFAVAIAVGAGIIEAVGFRPIYLAEAVVFTLVGLATLRLRYSTRPVGDAEPVAS